jgi:hypothetical protein
MIPRTLAGGGGIGRDYGVLGKTVLRKILWEKEVR